MWVAVSTTHGSFNRPRRRRAICERLSDAFGVRVVFPHEYPAFHTGLPTWPPFRGLLPLRPEVNPTLHSLETNPNSPQPGESRPKNAKTPGAGLVCDLTFVGVVCYMITRVLTQSTV